MSAEAATSLKDQGNAKFNAGQYQEALQLYRKAINLDPSNAVLFSNRSASHLKLGQNDEALADADQTCKLKPDWEKGHVRRGFALEAMGDLEKALPAYQRALDISPTSQEIISKVRKLKKAVKSAAQKADLDAAGSPATMKTIRVPPGGFGPPTSSGWARGLSLDKQAEWLVDCYRMRVDEDYAWGGNLHGLYEYSTDDSRSTKDTVCEDFLIFCKLAVRHGVVPSGWDWTRFLEKAAGLLPYAFEKRDAKEKYGGENIFTPMLGGRSLRFTGEVVYGSSSMAEGMKHGDNGKAFRQISKQVEQKWQQLVQGGGEVFDDVGGAQAWRQLHSALQIQSA